VTGGRIPFDDSKFVLNPATSTDNNLSMLPMAKATQQQNTPRQVTM
jgi:hypothetical protein